MGKLNYKNQPCSCGSGEKYKNCCMRLHTKVNPKSILTQDPSPKVMLSDYRSVTHYNGARYFILLKLGSMINGLKMAKLNDEDIQILSKQFIDLADHLDETYPLVLKSAEGIDRIKKLKMTKESWLNPRSTLNTTERVLLKEMAQSTLFTYLMGEEPEYSAMKTLFELCYQTLYHGLQDKPIASLSLQVGAQDELLSYDITYEENKKPYSLSKRNIIFPHWNEVSKNSKNVQSLHAQYADFSTLVDDSLPIFEAEVESVIGQYIPYIPLSFTFDVIEVSPYDISLGLPSVLLDVLYKVKEYLIRPETPMGLVQFLLNDVLAHTQVSSRKDFEKIKTLYQTTLEEYLYYTKLNDPKNTAIKELTPLEITPKEWTGLALVHLLLTEMKTSYTQMLRNSNPIYHYHLMLTMLDLAMTLLKDTDQHFSYAMTHPLITVFVEPSGKLIKFAITEEKDLTSLDSDDIRPTMHLIQYDPETFNDYVGHIYKKLSEHGRIQFSTGEDQHEELLANKKIGRRRDFWPYLSPYLKCIEIELRDRLGDLILKHIPEINTPITLGGFSLAFNAYPGRMNRILDKDVTKELAMALKDLSELRNKHAHEDIFTEEDYYALRHLLIEERLLEKILDIQPLKKIILSHKFLKDHHVLDEIILHKDRVDWLKFSKMPPAAHDHAEGIYNLTQLTDLYLNYPFMLKGNRMWDKFMYALIEPDTYGWLVQKDQRDPEGRASGFSFFDYKAMRINEKTRKIFYAFGKGSLNYSGEIRLTEKDSSLHIQGDSNLRTIRNLAYEEILDAYGEENLFSMFKDYHLQLFEELTLPETPPDYSRELLKKVLSTREIWSKKIGTIFPLYAVMAQILQVWYENMEDYSPDIIKTLAQACTYLLNNASTISYDHHYVYPYLVIELKDGEISHLSLENLMNGEDEHMTIELREIHNFSLNSID